MNDPKQDDVAGRSWSALSEQLGPPPQPVGHLHSNGEFCQDRPVDRPVLWPVNLYTEGQLRDAVAAEREWCAKLVENWPRGAGPHSNLPNAIRAGA